MKVLERKIRRSVNKQVEFIRENIDYFTIKQIEIIRQAINNVYEIERSVNILFIQGIIDDKTLKTLTKYFINTKEELNEYEYRVMGGNNGIINLFIKEYV